MTVYLNAGQTMRTTAGHSDAEFRYFVTTLYWPHVPHYDENGDAYYEADPSQKVYDPDALASYWVEYTDYITDSVPLFKEWSDDETTRWQVTLNGYNFDSRYIQADHAVLILYRLSPDNENGLWSDWHLLCLGYFKEDTIQQDATDAKRWSATAEGVSQYFEKRLVPALTFARTDIALNQPVTTSDLLTDMKLEAGKGEFLGLPENSGQNLTDGDDAVPCIFANEPTPNPEPMVSQAQNGNLRINEVYLRAPIGYPNGYQWFEIFNTNPHEPVSLHNLDAIVDMNDGTSWGISFPGLFPTVQGQGWTPSGSALAEDMDEVETSVAVTNPQNLGVGLAVRIEGEEMSVASDKVSPTAFNRPNMNWPHGIFHPSGSTIEKQGDVNNASTSTIPPHGFMILCENRRRLQELFRIPQGTIIGEWGDNYPGQRLDTTQGRIRLLNPFGEVDRVTWGTGDDSALHTPQDGIPRTAWNGARVPVPPLAQSFKRKVVGGGVGIGWGGWPTDEDSHSADDWTTEDVPTPGRRQAAIGSDGKRVVEDTAWFSVQLPALTCELTEDLNDGDTVLTVNNTHGFYYNRRNADSLLIVDQIVDYTLGTKTATTLTLAAAWAGGLVPAGTRLYPVDRNGVAHDTWPITSVELVRKQQPIPAVYTIYTSEIASPLYPSSDDAWKSEWTPVVWAAGQHIARLRDDIEDGDTVITVDTTDGWPQHGTAVVRTPSQTPNQYTTFFVQYKDRTPTTIILYSPWQRGKVLIEPATGQSTVGVVTQGNLHAIHTLQTARRAKHVLVVIDAMSDFGRGKLNAIRVYPDMGSTSDPQTQVDGSSAAALAFHICRTFGLPAAKFTCQTEDGTPIADGGEPKHDVTLVSVSTTEDTGMNVLRDLARKTGMHIRFGRADGVRWRPNPLHPFGAISGDVEDVDFTFTTETAMSFMEVRRAETATIGQAIVRYRLSGSNEVGVATYPARPAAPAHPYTLPDILVVPDDLTARYLAEMHYRRIAAPVEMTLRVHAIVTDWLHCMARVINEWSWDNHPDDPFWGYYYIVTSLDVLEEGEFPEETATTVLTLRRLRRAI